MSHMIADPSVAWAVELAVAVFIKGSLVVGTAGMVAWLLRDYSASARHAVWAIAFGCLLVLPPLSASLPAWRVTGLYVAVETDRTTHTACAGDDCNRVTVSGTQGSGPFAGTGDRINQVRTADPVERADWVARGAAERRRVPVGTWVLIVWGAGVVVVLGRFLLGVLHVCLITRRASECSAEFRSVAVPLMVGLGIRRQVRVLVSGEVSMPLSWGLIAPVLLFPKSADGWTTERKRVVLLHELAHVRRFDYAAHVLSELAGCLYWANPLVWLAARSGATECERACDDLALEAGIRSDVYAGHLLEIARGHLLTTPRGAFAMAQPSSLATRIKSVLSEGLERRPMSRLALIIVGLAGLAFVLPTASLDLWGVVRPGKNAIRAVIQGGDAVSQRIAELNDRDARVRRFAAWALGELESTRGVRPLMERLQDNNADVRLVAAWALGEIKDRTAIVPLIELLGDQDPLVREMAVLSLGEIEHGSAVIPLLEALDSDADLVEPVIWALGEIGAEARAERQALIRETGRGWWDNDQVWTGRLGTTGVVRERSRDLHALMDALGDTDAEVRCSAAEWLGVRGDARAVEPLLDTLRDPDPTVRAMAVWALDEINPSRH